MFEFLSEQFSRRYPEIFVVMKITKNLQEALGDTHTFSAVQNGSSAKFNVYWWNKHRGIFTVYTAEKV